MKAFWKELKLKITVLIIYILLLFSNWTIDLKVIGKDRLDKIKKQGDNPPVLYSFWHRYIWLGAYYFRYQNAFTMASLSQDGEYITRVIKKMGWQVVRGSSSRGGSSGLLKLYRQLKKGEPVVLTPDGPTGPIYSVKPGMVYLQEKSEGYIVPLGFAVDKKKVINSWDRFVLPYPFTGAVLSIGEPRQLPPGKSIEERCQLVEKEMKKVQIEAEDYLVNPHRNGGK